MTGWGFSNCDVLTRSDILMMTCLFATFIFVASRPPSGWCQYGTCGRWSSFLDFGSIITGDAASSQSSPGNQCWVFHNGNTKMPVAPTRFVFFNTLLITAQKEKHRLLHLIWIFEFLPKHWDLYHRLNTGLAITNFKILQACLPPLICPTIHPTPPPPIHPTS